jgi:hypothetical protein
MSQINKELAVKILDKLKGKKTGSKGAAHIEYAIEHEGQVIALTNLRHGSSKELGHDHMQRDLHVSTGFAKLLGQCPKSRKDYIETLQENGIIARPGDDADEQPDEGAG